LLVVWVVSGSFYRGLVRKIYDLFLILIVKILVQHRNFPVKGVQQGQHDLPDLGVGGLITTEVKNVSPFPDVGGDDDLCFQAVGQHTARLLGGSALFNQVQVRFFGGLDRSRPLAIFVRIQLPEKGPNYGYFAAEFFLGIIGVPRAFLAEGTEPVPDDFVGDAPVANDTNRNADMFKDAVMTRLDQPF